MEADAIGKVVDCKHCGGTGRCSCSGCHAVAGVLIPPRSITFHTVACATCKGVGSVWIGPQNITVITR